jgi:DNA-binding transcriptional LysR family regulator
MTTFVRIADAGSITKAARSLRLSVPMASRQLRALETDLGVELIRRTTRALALTEAGAEFLVRSRALLAGVSEARDVVRPGRGVAGVVSVSLPVSFGLAQVGPLFPALLEAHPRLKLDLRFEDRLIDLLGDGVDLAIRAGTPPPDSPFVIARKLATVDRVLCASPAFLARHGRIASIEALARVPCLLQGPPPTRWSFDTPHGPASVEVDGRVRTTNVIALREAALAGLGVARLPTWIVDEDLRKKRVVRVLENAAMPIIEIYGMFHAASKGSTAIRAVLDYLHAELPRRTKMARA